MTQQLQFKDRNISLDKAGYLKNYQDWDDELACVLAEKEGIEMSESHWEVVWFVREFYLEFNTSPAIRALVKAMAARFGPEKGNSRYLFRLFPDGPAKQATKIAGLPKPAKCL
ncbi:TusE/DsrC/DsvC family sulfur relay protein [Lacimicrobium alkaliphilum]|uniref:Sulfurtransferase n=1 Tax=Lacimicrobium alkaliphilum TaxID=1526571 RepID=A0ABQ1RQK4_9ALTE|nr:TusE/DsrC/DsvC family sulfur relay protein [Lacimicrobium alkaliphilum]GGD78107.1 sulfurtransferase [Lacimicrobium alkaliphilum]